MSQNLIEEYLVKNLETLFNDFKIRDSRIAELKKKEKNLRTPEIIQREMSRLNMLFQKGRIEWDYYNDEYTKLDNELKSLSPVIEIQKKDYSHIESLLEQDFISIYSKLTDENKRAFWQSVIKQIYITEDHQVEKVDFL